MAHTAIGGVSQWGGVADRSGCRTDIKMVFMRKCENDEAVPHTELNYIYAVMQTFNISVVFLTVSHILAYCFRRLAWPLFQTVCHYCSRPRVKPGASSLPGWTKTIFKSTGLQKRSLGHVLELGKNVSLGLQINFGSFICKISIYFINEWHRHWIHLRIYQ